MYALQLNTSRIHPNSKKIYQNLKSIKSCYISLRMYMSLCMTCTYFAHNNINIEICQKNIFFICCVKRIASLFFTSSCMVNFKKKLAILYGEMTKVGNARNKILMYVFE